MTLREVLNHLRVLAPETSALPGDPVGLLIGSEDDRPVSKIGVCLDATPETCDRAVREGINLIVAHHPLIYYPLKRLDTQADPIARAALCLATNHISLYAMHTNWDCAPGGISDTLAECLELVNVERGGTEGELVFLRVGDLPAPRPLPDFARFVEQTLACAGTSALRCVAADPHKMVRRVAVCGGAGAGLLRAARARGADAFVTADVRHHEFLEGAGIGVALLDAGHEATENPGMRALLQILARQLPGMEVVWAGT